MPSLETGPISSPMKNVAERYTFSSLHDFLYVELGKAILRGNAPRQCRLCGRWFLHEQGDRAMYFSRSCSMICAFSAASISGVICSIAASRSAAACVAQALRNYDRAIHFFFSARFPLCGVGQVDPPRQRAPAVPAVWTLVPP